MVSQESDTNDSFLEIETEMTFFITCRVTSN